MNDIEILEETTKALKVHNLNFIMLNFDEIAKAIENLLKERQADKERTKELGAINAMQEYRINEMDIPKSLIKEKMQQMNKTNWDKYSMSYDYIYNNGRYDVFKELLREKQDLQINKEE